MASPLSGECKGPIHNAGVCIEKTRTTLSSSCGFVGKSLGHGKGHGDCDAQDREHEDNRRQPSNFTQLCSYSDPHLLNPT
jgi:hypothetical protein